MYWPLGLNIALLLLLGGVLFHRHVLVYERRLKKGTAIKVSLAKTSLIYIVFAPTLWGIEYGLNAFLPDNLFVTNFIFLASLGIAWAIYAGANSLLNKIWGL